MSYKEKWDDYKKRSRIYWFAVMVFVVALAIGLPLAVTKFSPTLFYVYLSALGAAGFAISVFGFYQTHWKCPRCGQPFFRRPDWLGKIFYNLFARRCMNCGLPKWAENDDVK
ncbi:MAG: hypothetical protein ACR2HG_11185 [Pyrinomonadaceae bacterium]